MNKPESDGPADTMQERSPEAAAQRRFEDLPPAAQRALKEAEARRKARAEEPRKPTELGGRGGEDPSRFGDWEIDGRAIDF